MTRKEYSKRRAEFLSVFRLFPKTRLANEYICNALSVTINTLHMWRCKNKTMYTIPKSKMEKLHNHLSQNPPPDLD